MNKKTRQENKIFFEKFFSSFLWNASGITVKDDKYNKLSRLEKMCFLRDKIIASEKGRKIVNSKLTKRK